jgi:hypothetical protein
MIFKRKYYDIESISPVDALLFGENSDISNYILKNLRGFFSICLKNSEFETILKCNTIPYLNIPNIDKISDYPEGTEWTITIYN